MNWFWAIIEHSMEQMQVVWVYILPKTAIQHIADRFFEQGRVLDYEVIWYMDLDSLNEYLRNEIVLPYDDD